jgi:hypothetical protein
MSALAAPLTGPDAAPAAPFAVPAESARDDAETGGRHA